MITTHRCYGMMDSRGRWRAWLFGPETPAARGRLVAEAKTARQVLFASVQTFAPPQNKTAGMTRWRRVREQYIGPEAMGHLAPLFFDIDCEGNLEKALLWTRTLTEFFISQLTLPEAAVRVWFSGSKGAHVMVSAAALGIKPSATLTADMKLVAMELVRHLTSLGAPETAVDSSVYSMPRMIRLPDQVNPKSGLFKVELSHRELLQCSIAEILELARRPRGALWQPQDLPDKPVPQAAQWWSAALSRARQPREFRIKTAQVAGLKVRPDGYLVDDLTDTTMPSCIENMVHATVSPGSRNRCELQIACWAKAAKIPFDRSLSLLAGWTTVNRPELSSSNAHAKADSILRSVYSNRSYGFSCAAARSAAKTTGVTAQCEQCRAIKPRSRRQLFSLRVRHNEQWSVPKRIPLEKARGQIARAIDNRIAATSPAGAGDSTAGCWKDSCGNRRAGRDRSEGSLCSANT